MIAEINSNVQFFISLATLASIVGAFTTWMFSRFRAQMAEDTRTIVKEETKPILDAQTDMKAQIGTLSEGLKYTTELSLKHETDLTGKDGIFSRVSHIEGRLNIGKQRQEESV